MCYLQIGIGRWYRAFSLCKAVKVTSPLFSNKARFEFCTYEIIIKQMQILNSYNRVFSFGQWKKMTCAVVLSGAGVYDGTEITEAVGLNINLLYTGNIVSFFAPNIDQHHVINHLKGEPVKQKRNVLEESARIARGKIQDLKMLNVVAANFDALFLPGGFGAAKNLSTFAIDSSKMTVNDDIERVVREFHASKKPIGACCIAPIILARVLGSSAKITLGMKSGDCWPYAGSIGAAQSFGATVVEKNIDEVCVDHKNLIVTTPAYMYDKATALEVYLGIGKMVTAVNELLRS